MVEAFRREATKFLIEKGATLDVDIRFDGTDEETLRFTVFGKNRSSTRGAASFPVHIAIYDDPVRPSRARRQSSLPLAPPLQLRALPPSPTDPRLDARARLDPERPGLRVLHRQAPLRHRNPPVPLQARHRHRHPPRRPRHRCVPLPHPPARPISRGRATEATTIAIRRRQRPPPSTAGPPRPRAPAAPTPRGGPRKCLGK